MMLEPSTKDTKVGTKFIICYTPKSTLSKLLVQRRYKKCDNKYLLLPIITSSYDGAQNIAVRILCSYFHKLSLAEQYW